jgi:hypothetical protein
LPLVRDFTEKDFNKYIAVYFLINPDPIIMLGRIVQIRQEWGQFGSNQIFIRCCDDRLQVHENQAFHFLPDHLAAEADQLFKDVDLDEPDIPYSLQGKDRKKGFIIKSRVKQGSTTPMRELMKDLRKVFGDDI